MRIFELEIVYVGYGRNIPILIPTLGTKKIDFKYNIKYVNIQNIYSFN